MISPIKLYIVNNCLCQPVLMIVIWDHFQTVLFLYSSQNYILFFTRTETRYMYIEMVYTQSHFINTVLEYYRTYNFTCEVKRSEVAQSFSTLCNPMDCSILCSSTQGIFQARVLEWVAISFPRASSWPRDRTQVSHTVGRCFTVWATRGVLNFDDTVINKGLRRWR